MLPVKRTTWPSNKTFYDTVRWKIFYLKQNTLDLMEVLITYILFIMTVVR